MHLSVTETPMEKKKEIREETLNPDLPSVVGIIGELHYVTTSEPDPHQFWIQILSRSNS
jgi:hypothetical protein